MRDIDTSVPQIARSASRRSRIGTGIPTANNTHEVAQRYAPDSRIVYVDSVSRSPAGRCRAPPAR